MDATYEVEDGTYVAEPLDVTDSLGSDDLEKYMNQSIAMKGLKVEASKDANGEDAAFLYNYDGSGTEGDDLYFNVSANGATYTFTVESYLCGKDTDVYKAVENLNIGDTISLRERATRLSRMLGAADVIIESAVALTQEIHDGPFERYTGHGMWSAWDGHPTYSLEGKTLVRVDLDPALDQVCAVERSGGAVQRAIADGLPKTKMFKVPFRMEMSGFARHEGSIPLIGDIGAVWPLIALGVAERLGVELEFLSAPQDTDPGRAMREWIVSAVKPVSREKMLREMARRAGG